MIRELERELWKIREIDDQDVKDTILRFHEALRVEELSDRRILFHIQKARTINHELGLLPFNIDKLRQCVTWALDQQFEQWTITGYKLFFRKFWIFLNGEDIEKDAKALLKVKRPKDNGKKPADLITEDEITKLIGAAHTLRDKAVIQLLYDSGVRSEELRTLRLNDIEFLGDRMRVKVNGKTGSRVVVVLGDSMRILKDYINAYSIKGNDAWLFPGNDGFMTAATLQKILNVCSGRAGMRHVYPHLFRYSRATLLAKTVAEAPLESQMGWVHGSNMTRTYVKLSLRDQEEAIFNAYSKDNVDNREIRSPKIHVTGPRICPRCNHENSVSNGFCSQCGFNLNAKIGDAIDQDMPINKALAELETLKRENAKLQNTVSEVKTLVTQYSKEIRLKKTNIRINKADFPGSEVDIDKSVVDFIVGQVMETLKRENPDFRYH